MELELSQFIDRPPADVFRFYAIDHVRNHPRWDTGIQLEQITDGPIGVGTVIRRRHSRYGEPTEGTMEVVEFEPERAMRVDVHDGPLEMRGWMSMRPEGEGTLLTIGFEVLGSDEPIDPAPLQRTLDTIKEMIESDAS